MFSTLCLFRAFPKQCYTILMFTFSCSMAVNSATPTLFISSLSALSHFPSFYIELICWSVLQVHWYVLHLSKFFCYCSESVIWLCLYLHKDVWLFFCGCCGLLWGRGNRSQIIEIIIISFQILKCFPALLFNLG